jgi:hypothetical protein
MVRLANWLFAFVWTLAGLLTCPEADKRKEGQEYGKAKDS